MLQENVFFQVNGCCVFFSKNRPQIVYNLASGLHIYSCSFRRSRAIIISHRLHRYIGKHKMPSNTVTIVCTTSFWTDV